MLACFLATLTAYVERVGFSIAFTEMAKQVRRQGAAAGGRRRGAAALAGWLPRRLPGTDRQPPDAPHADPPTGWHAACSGCQATPCCLHSISPRPIPPPGLQANVGEGVKGTVMSAFYWGYALSQASPC